MNKFLLTLPVCVALVVGCNADTPAAVTGETTATSNAATPASATSPAAAAKPVATTKSATTNAPAPDKGYRVVEEGQPGMPPEMLAALKAVKVSPPPAALKVPKNARVQLQTSKGNITIQLDTAAAPLHTKSFYYLVQKGFYNGTVFHRGADLMEGSGTPGNIIQGGDPLTRNPKTAEFAGGGGPGYQVPRERNKLTHTALVIAAARTSDPNSAGSQFYITQNPVAFLDQGDGYTVFGRVLAGKDVALKLKQDDKITKAVILR